MVKPAQRRNRTAAALRSSTMLNSIPGYSSRNRRISPGARARIARRPCRVSSLADPSIHTTPMPVIEEYAETPTMAAGTPSYRAV